MHRHGLPTGIALAVVGVALYWANAFAFSHVLVVEHRVVPQTHTRDFACVAKIGGEVVQLQLGQGIESDKGWLNCQTYDGHPLVVYSNKPPELDAVENSY